MDRPGSVLKYEFNPLALMQRRPPREIEDPTNTGLGSLLHERTHWFQFAGTTFGSFFMTLIRAEELRAAEVLASPQRQAEPGASTPTGSRSSSYATFGEAGTETVRALRALRSALFTGAAESATRSMEASLPEVMANCDEAYARHTGRVRPWSVNGRTESWARIARVHDSSSSPVQLTWRHLLEAHAWLNEWTPLLVRGWSHGLERFAGLSAPTLAFLEDGLGRVPSFYRRAADHALAEWNDDLRTDEAGSSLAARLSRALPTLAACLDVALNPPVAPLCAPNDLGPESVLPTRRFVALVEAVHDVGLISQWPNDADFSGYCSALSSNSGVPLGSMESASFQNDLFSEDFFSSVEIGDPTLAKMSYFDYFIFASERLHNERQQRPLRAALPALYFHEHPTGRPDWNLLARAWLYAPLIWQGDELHNAPSMSAGLVSRLTIDLMCWNVVRDLASGLEVLDLTDRFPPEAFDFDPTGSAILKAVSAAVGVDVRSRTFMPASRTKKGPLYPQIESLQFEPPRVEMVEITRQQIVAEDLLPVMDRLADFKSDPISHARSLNFSISGYWSDARELWEIPEVRRYFQALKASAPEWAWYTRIAQRVEDSSGFFLLLTADVVDPLSPTDRDLERMLMSAFSSMNIEANQSGADSDLVRRLSEDIGSFVRMMISSMLESTVDPESG